MTNLARLFVPMVYQPCKVEIKIAALFLWHPWLISIPGSVCANTIFFLAVRQYALIDMPIRRICVSYIIMVLYVSWIGVYHSCHRKAWEVCQWSTGGKIRYPTPPPPHVRGEICRRQLLLLGFGLFFCCWDSRVVAFGFWACDEFWRWIVTDSTKLCMGLWIWKDLSMVKFY